MAILDRIETVELKNIDEPPSTPCMSVLALQTIKFSDMPASL